MVTRRATLAALIAGATLVGFAALAARSIERHVVRGESMKPTLRPKDVAVSIRLRSPLGRLRRPRVGDIAIIELPWEHDLIGIKRLVAAPGEAWEDATGQVPAGPGWAVVGDERTLSTDSRHHGRVPETAIRGLLVSRIAPTAHP